MSDTLSCCRECSHFKFLHRFNNDDPGLWRSGQNCDPQNDHGCDCEEFVPEDNLDYVEWLAEKRGLLK